jgi:isopentenyl-diphosphate delta-isomerase
MDDTFLKQQVLLVNQKDQVLGTMPILEAHSGSGALHRAVSVVLYRTRPNTKEMLLQKRSSSKLLWPRYWSNTICTHPRENEESVDCCVRRLHEEMGISYKKEDLSHTFTLTYEARYTKELIEKEVDSVFSGVWEGTPIASASEVEEYAWVPIEKLTKDVANNPSSYTPWFIKLLQAKEMMVLFNI